MSAPAAHQSCPKHMIYGPCGGVQADGECEIGGLRCTFLDLELPRWSGADGRSAAAPLQPAAAMAELLRSRDVVVADFPGAAMDVESLRACARELAGSVDAVLLGDSGADRVQFSPSWRAYLVQQQGVAAWSGLNCRDRNRVALQGELASLAAVGVAGVHCVTGDHPRTGHRPDAAPVFDLDSARLAALAASFGHLVSVAESPASVPVRLRPERLIEKLAAGARVCFVNHCGPADRVRDFVSRTADLGGSPVDFIACVPVVVDRGSAALLASFTSLVLPDGFLDRILAAADPHREGVRAAVELGQQLLDIGGVRGINLSGGPTPGGEHRYASAMAEVGELLRG